MNSQNKTLRRRANDPPKQLFRKRLASLLIAFASSNLILLFKTTSAIAEPFTLQLLTQQSICKNLQTQTALNQCSALRAEAIDKQLNQVYRQVRAKYKGSENENLLINAQIDWIKYRDSTCSFSMNRYKGGSMASMVYSDCLGRMTKQRIDELKTYLEEG